MRKWLFWSVVVISVSVGSSAWALTQHPFSNPGVDVRVFPPPCSPLEVPGSAVAGAVPVFTSAGEVTALVFTCRDGQVFVRIYGGPAAAPASCPGLSPFPGGVCQDGGWLPSNHPLVRR
jgi:hypothetical protein